MNCGMNLSRNFLSAWTEFPVDEEAQFDTCDMQEKQSSWCRALPARGHCPGGVCCRTKDRNSYSACWRVMWLSRTACVKPDWQHKPQNTHQAHSSETGNTVSICTHLPMMLFAPVWHAVKQIIWLVDDQIWPLTTTKKKVIALKSQYGHFFFYLVVSSETYTRH